MFFWGGCGGGGGECEGNICVRISFHLYINTLLDGGVC